MKERIVLLIVMISLVKGYDSLSDRKKITDYYQLNSQYPIIHVFHNREFPKSKQFKPFLEVIEALDRRNHDYAKFLLTNCDEIAPEKTRSCEKLKQSKENHMIVGYQPSTNFQKYGDKKIQKPPTLRQFSRQLQVYQVQEIQALLKQLMPNFYEQIDSLEQYEKWLEPYYSPNLIFASRDDQLPQVILKLGVNYFQRFDLAFVSDLSDEVTKNLNITNFPVLLVITFNFTSGQHQVLKYPHSDFLNSQYYKIKQFLEPLALKKQRNDIFFHKIKMPTQSQIVTTKSLGQLAELLDQANRRSLISLNQGKPIKLEALKDKYGDFFEYYHLQDDKHQEQTLRIFDSHSDIPNKDINDLKFLTLNEEEFIQKMTLWLSKDFVVIGVRQKYSHFCGLEHFTLFRGLVHCLAVFEKDYEKVSKSLNIQFDIGFVSYDVNGTGKISWQNFKSPKFQTVYRTVQDITHQKTEQIIQLFLQKPINKIQGTMKLSQLCFFPTKKCALLFTHPTKKSNTAFEYLSEVAKEFIFEYNFFQIDLSCNPQFTEEIQSLKEDPRGLFVYDPPHDAYVYQKTKISKTAFRKFLQTSLKASEKNPFQQNRRDLLVHSCSDNKRESDSL